MRPASGLPCFWKKQRADARFHPPVAAFRYQYARGKTKYADFLLEWLFFRQEKTERKQK